MTITTEQQWFLQALKNFIHPGQVCEMDGAVSLEEVAQLARMHTVLPFVFDAVAQMPAGDESAEALKARWKQQTFRTVFSQTIRSQTFLGLCRAFREAGVKVLVVKGILCRSLYPKADYRTSSDEDCFVSPEDFPAVHKILLDFGLKVTDPAEGELEQAQVVTYAHSVSGLRIELHRQLFSQNSRAYGSLNEVFAQAMDRAVEVEIDGTALWSLCPTDHMLYLLFHAYKHFLHSGFGIRQVCDICIYAERFEGAIDWPRVEACLRSFRAEVFAAALWKIGEEYLGFQKSDYIMVKVPPVEELLLDILSGGVYGTASEDRQHSSLITLNAVTGQGQRASVLRTIFPDAASLKGAYPWLNDKPWLLPVAWARRIFAYLKKGGETSAAASVRIGSQRVELMRQLGMLDRQSSRKKSQTLRAWILKIAHGRAEPISAKIFQGISSLEYAFFSVKWVIQGKRLPDPKEREAVEENVTFLFKSFERQKMAKRLYRNIRKYYPRAQIVIADDSKQPLELRGGNLKVLQLPYNSGLSFGLNRALKEVKTPFVMRLDDDELLTPCTRIGEQLEFLQTHSFVDLVGFGVLTTPRCTPTAKAMKALYRQTMQGAPKKLLIPHMTVLDEGHIVVGKPFNVFLARTEKIREIGWDDNIRMIDHNEFFIRAAGNLVSVAAPGTVIFHYHNPFDGHYQKYRQDVADDRIYIQRKYAALWRGENIAKGGKR